MTTELSRRVNLFLQAEENVFGFFSNSTYARRQGDPNIADFAIGNPHEMPLQGFVEALQKRSVPQNKDWFAYKMSEPESQEIVAQSLRNRYGTPFERRDIFMTTGAFSALTATLATMVNPGDEVIFNSPPWFFYEGMIASFEGVAVRVAVDRQTFDLDLDAIGAAITAKTRAIIVNSPNNPTGRIYPPETLERLGKLLDAASTRIGHPIYLLSDEAYSRIIYDGNIFTSPTAYYPNSFLIYTYGKTMLTPGQRLGYVALPPTMPDRATWRTAMMTSLFLTGYSYPNALLQHALSDIEQLSIDIPHLQVKRDRMVSALRTAGYEVHVPQGTFYLLPRAPIPDDWAFVELLAKHDIFVLPGKVVELPGYFRISLTANDAMIERALPGFATAYQEALVATL